MHKYNIIFYLTILCNILTSNTIYAKNKSFSLYSTVNGTSIEKKVINKKFTESSSIQNISENSISGLSVTAKVKLNGVDSYVRIILVSPTSEYLVYEGFHPKDNIGEELTITYYAYETSLLDDIIPLKLNIEMNNAECELSEIIYNKQQSTFSSKSTFHSKKTTIRQDQDSIIIAKINENIRKLNQKWIAGETSLSKMSYNERKAMLGKNDKGEIPNLNGFEYYVGGIFEVPSSNPQVKSGSSPGSSLYVSEYSWKEKHGKNWISPVKNQGGCASCWAFSSTGVTEALVNLYYNQLINLDLSEQELVSCANAGNCVSGGSPGAALNYIKSTGIISEPCFTYQASDLDCSLKCASSTEKIQIGGSRYISNHSDDTLKKLVLQRPLNFGISPWWHTPVLIGYKTVQEGDNIFVKTSSETRWVQIAAGDPLIGKTAWLIKNSWGTTWGDQGYAYVVTNSSDIYLTYDVYGPITSLQYDDNDIVCVDADGDGYYTWGTGPKPSSCPPCPNEPDGDDSDPNIGPMDEFGYYQILNDSAAPSIPTGLVANGITETGVTLSWNASTDNYGVARYKVYRNGSNPINVANTSISFYDLEAGTQYEFTVSAVDESGNESAQCSPIIVNALQPMVTSSATWQSFNESIQTGTFTVKYDAVPNGNNIDALTGIQNGTPSAYGDVACIIRFNSNGQIDARNGSSYTSSNIINYTAGLSYSFRIEIDVPSHTYSAYVSEQGGSEKTVASNFAFRTEQASVSQLTGWSVYAYAGSHTVSNMQYAINTDILPPSVPTGFWASQPGENYVTLFWDASTDNVGVTGYKIYTNGANPKTVTQTNTVMSNLTSNTSYSFSVSAIDAAGNESAQSSPINITTLLPSVTSSNAWQSFSKPTQTGAFTVTYRAIPHGNNVDALTGIQNGTPNAYGDVACIIRFNSNGQIDARNGSSYTSTNTINYTAEATYYFRVEVNVPAHTYTVYVSEEGGVQQTVASNFAFRTEQANVSQLTGWSIYAYAGSHSVSHMIFSSGSGSESETDNNTSLTETLDPSVKIYPNPLNGNTLYFDLYNYNGKQVNLTIRDLLGKIVYNNNYHAIGEEKESLSIQTGNLSSGIYIISLKGENVSLQQKLIIE